MADEEQQDQTVSEEKPQDTPYPGGGDEAKEEAPKEEPKPKAATPREDPKPDPKPAPKAQESPRKEKDSKTTPQPTPRQEKQKTTPRNNPAHQDKKPARRTVSEKDVEEETTTATSEGRLQQREFFKEELRRLQNGLQRESSKIHPPRPRKYTPFIFNTLEPYYNTHTTKFLIEMPDADEQFFTFSSRNTAQGLTDPWIDLRMDNEILPQIPGSSRPNTRADPKVKRKNIQKLERSKTSVNRKEGSTRLPKFPVVNLETKELATKQLYYSDVPMLRKELKTKYSSQAKTKVDADYKRTHNDFYRMELDRLDQVAPTNRRHMTSTYMAYLNNTPGSRRAVSECVRTLEGKAN